MKRKKWNLLQYSISGIMILYLGVLVFPEILFSQVIHHNNFSVYSHSELDGDIYSILDTAQNRIEDSEIFDDEVIHNIYLCNTNSEYAFFALWAQNSFACKYPGVNSIFVSASDVNRDLVRKPQSDEFRSLSGTITHEATHNLIENELGIISYKFLERWKNEGYCDYIAQESSIKYEDGIFKLCEHKLDHTYFKYRLWTEYLILNKNQLFKEIVDEDFDTKQLSEQVKQHYCN